MRDDLPTPRGPAMPRVSAFPVCGYEARITGRMAGSWFSTAEMVRASSRRSCRRMRRAAGGIDGRPTELTPAVEPLGGRSG